MTHPYADLPAKAFWKTAVADRDMQQIESTWEPKFEITPDTRIATFGSCFAQHFGRELRNKQYRWLNTEPAPAGFSDEMKANFNYEAFSARTGNIYTTSLLNQWVSWAAGDLVPPEESWKKDDRFYDPFRVRIEPNGFASHSEVIRSRTVTINALRTALEKADIFVFTLGLTESWFNKREKFEYPICPGTVAGEYDEDEHEFLAQGYEFSIQNLREAISTMRRINRNIRVLLTVSPVPLTATNSGNHVLIATSASKAILRTLAETVSSESDFVDYFPSFELINSPVFKGAFFEPNMRSVTMDGVGFVMKTFFSSLKQSLQSIPSAKTDEYVGQNAASTAASDRESSEDLSCDEELLSMYAPEKPSRNAG